MPDHGLAKLAANTVRQRFGLTDRLFERYMEVHMANMGGLDRAVRFLIAIAIGVLWFNGVIHGALALVLGVIALAFVATSVVGWCPLYVPLRLSTLRRMTRSA
jgi:hypothetical protein